MRVYLLGPGVGPLRTVLWSSRGRRLRPRRSRGPWWPRRHRTLRYWLLGLWAIEAWFWGAYALVLGVAWAWRWWTARARRRRATVA